MVVKLFGEVENKSVPIPEFPEHPFQEEHLKVSFIRVNFTLCLLVKGQYLSFNEYFSINILRNQWLDNWNLYERSFFMFSAQQFYKVVPIKDIRNLYVTFPIPDLQKYYKSNPGHYLGHLIGHEGPGSLLSELKSKGKIWSEHTFIAKKCVNVKR